MECKGQIKGMFSKGIMSNCSGIELRPLIQTVKATAEPQINKTT